MKFREKMTRLTTVSVRERGKEGERKRGKERERRRERELQREGTRLFSNPWTLDLHVLSDIVAWWDDAEAKLNPEWCIVSG